MKADQACEWQDLYGHGVVVDRVHEADGVVHGSTEGVEGDEDRAFDELLAADGDTRDGHVVWEEAALDDQALLIGLCRHSVYSVGREDPPRRLREVIVESKLSISCDGVRAGALDRGSEVVDCCVELCPREEPCPVDDDDDDVVVVDCPVAF